MMCVPAHDQRDWEFAKRYNLPIIEVISPRTYADGNADPRGKIRHQSAFNQRESAYEGEGFLINSGKFDGMDSEKAKPKLPKPPALETSETRAGVVMPPAIGA